MGGSSGTVDGADAALAAIQRHLIDRHGLDLARYKPTYLRRRLLVRVRALRLGGLEVYARHLRRHPGEITPLLRALSIKVTGFFRNRGCFGFLEEHVVPDLLRRAADEGRRVRVWSAGCATGEEAWSLAALFAAAAAKDRRRGPRTDILATDLDETALETARAGVYTAPALRAATPASCAGLFAVRADGSVVPDPCLRRMTTFRRENLLEGAGHENLDLVVCRNVLIYFEVGEQESLLERFAAVLRPGGYLMLGRVERLFGPARSRFEVVSARDRIYRRLPRGTREDTASDRVSGTGEAACA